MLEHLPGEAAIIPIFYLVRLLRTSYENSVQVASSFGFLLGERGHCTGLKGAVGEPELIECFSSPITFCTQSIILSPTGVSVYASQPLPSLV